MRRFLVALFLIVLVFDSEADAQRRRRAGRVARRTAPASTCPRTLRDIRDCPAQGCGRGFDANLNLRKNVRSDGRDPAIKTLAWMKMLDNPVGFKEGDTREKLTALGEGQKVTVVAYALIVRPGSPESCNCGLSRQSDADNHIVLVEEETLGLTAGATRARRATARRKAVKARSAKENTLDLRERQSVTAEFTPRVRLDHPELVRFNLQPLIDAAPGSALLVRVTGLLMFDSEHFLGRPLKRVTDWEVHPVLELEYCATGVTCTARSDRGWRRLGESP